MITGLWAQTDFFDLNFGLRFSRFAFLLFFFVEELAVVDDFANGRVGIRSDLYQIQTDID
jgi:hypothetical protein